MTTIAGLLVAVAACRSTAPDVAPAAEYDHACEESRPSMCTREYRPVCGLKDTGIRCVTTPCPSSEWQTYGNACAACSNAEVFGYDAGACPVSDTQPASRR